MDSRLKENDAVLFIDRKGRRYLKMIRPGKKILIRGEMRAEDLIGVEEGSRVKLSTGEKFLVLRPTYADLIPHLPRSSQVIYPKDTGPLLIWGDVFPGATVIEGGTGAGALTIALLRAGGKEGRVISYELREDFADAARKNVAAFFGDAPNWTIKVRDLYHGFDETGVDRMFMDIAEPGRALDMASDALRPGGVLVCYVPTAIQLKDTVEAIQSRSDFGEVESFETLLRHWQVKGLSVRPHFRMIAHSAFIIVSRRLVPIAAPSPINPAEPVEVVGDSPDHDDSDVVLPGDSAPDDDPV
ncbi:MAG: tRNA (adenine-N1)-methyltransferase [Candidatus Binatus sp.]|uniref:tRNA (adenine-N1)-methyltransferase n=1 Tax=Candidatus Binatus sp. TaxID=2811406 RepID=UPI00271C5F7D|nr:tRNA (adenine-N1)-methyltransferase [Candidatus Binatus sp.]MDO8431123.1 tRNA (adenine-N1)-methyltransferase [Candidatus Binatus sp.]